MKIAKDAARKEESEQHYSIRVLRTALQGWTSASMLSNQKHLWSSEHGCCTAYQAPVQDTIRVGHTLWHLQTQDANYALTAV